MGYSIHTQASQAFFPALGTRARKSLCIISITDHSGMTCDLGPTRASMISQNQPLCVWAQWLTIAIYSAHLLLRCNDRKKNCCMCKGGGVNLWLPRRRSGWSSSKIEAWTWASKVYNLFKIVVDFPRWSHTLWFHFPAGDSGLPSQAS